MRSPRVCNLYTLKASGNQIEDAFAAVHPPDLNADEGDVYLGGHGDVGQTIPASCR